MRTLPAATTLLLTALAIGCGPAAAAALPGGTLVASAAGDPACTLHLHAVLRKAGALRVLGQVHFQIEPAESGTEAPVSYWGRIGAADGAGYAMLSASVLPRVPDDGGPTWTDYKQSDPGMSLGATWRFATVSFMSPELAAALVDDPGGYKAVLRLAGATGELELEGSLVPSGSSPEQDHDRLQVCFATG